MADRTTYSDEVLAHPSAQTDAALDRITIAKKRIQSILDRDTAAHQKTLEQKISEQGPTPQRVDPHLVGLAVLDLLNLNRLRDHRHTATGTKPWYANPATTDIAVKKRLDDIAPLYDSVSGHGFGNLTGDALEVITFKCLEMVQSGNAQFAYQGAFFLNEPKNAQGRFRKIQPPKNIGPCVTDQEADFLQFGHRPGPLCIECKNRREWVYPQDQAIIELIQKAADLNSIPVLIARRLHYTTRTNLLQPAGIIAHESYFQYYPSDKADIAEKVRHKRSLGFTDVLATEEPHARTVKFFTTSLPSIVESMATKWRANRDALVEYAQGHINLAQLYNAIESPAAGNWRDAE